MITILQTLMFKKQVKKLHQNQKKDLDKAIKKIAEDLSIGVFKKGDLCDVQVYKFKMVNRLTLLAYEYHNDRMQLMMLAL